MRDQLDWRASRRRRFNSSVAALSVAVLYVAGPTAAFAQDEGAPAGNREIVVTAQFREQNLQDTPLAITALDAATLEARGQTNIRDIATAAPNVSIDQTAAGYGPSAQVTIRGMGQFDSTPALEPGVGIYIDDVYYSSVFGNVFDLLDLDRVEILRGPQGTLAGKNSLGGAIKLFSKKPTGEADGYAEASYGSYNLVTLKAASNFTIVPDQMFLRVSGSFKHRDGYVTQKDYGCVYPDSGVPRLASSDDCVLGYEGGGNDFGLRAALRWVPSDMVEINIRGDYSQMNGQPTPATLVFARNGTVFMSDPPVIDPAYTIGNGLTYEDFVSTDPYVTYATYQGANPPFSPPREVTLEAWGVSGQIDVELADNVSVTSITAYRNHSGTLIQDADASPLELGLTYNPLSLEQFTQELRLNASFGDMLDVTVGGFYFEGNARNYGRIESNGLRMILNDLQESSNKSVFAHAVLHPTENLNITGGIRYSKESKTFTFGRLNTATLTPEGCLFNACAIDGVGATAEEGRVDYRAAIDYRFSDSFMAYAQYSTGFKGGGVNPRPYYQNQVTSVSPEVLKAWEIGFKSDFLDRMVRLNISAFWNKYEDIQVRAQTPFTNPDLPIQEDPLLPFYNPAAGTFPASIPMNIGSADVKGIEAELTIDPGNGLLVQGAVSYLDFQYGDIPVGSLVYSSGLREWMKTPYTPEWKASLGVSYEIDLGGAGSLTPRVDYSYQSSMYSIPQNAPTNYLGPRNIVNARLTYLSEDRDWEAAVAVTNLTNDFYYHSIFDLYAVSGYATGVPSRPREWQVSIKRRF